MAACGAARGRVAAAEGATREEAATTTRVEAATTVLATRMVVTRVIRETDFRAGGRTAAAAAGTAGYKSAAAMTTGKSPTRGCIWFCQLRPSPDCFQHSYMFFFV